jgi:hypothetical protein
MAFSLLTSRSSSVIRAHVRVEAEVRCDEEVRFHLPLHLIRGPKLPIPRQVYKNFLALRNAVSLAATFCGILRCGILLGVLRLAGPFPRPSQLASRSHVRACRMLFSSTSDTSTHFKSSVNFFIISNFHPSFKFRDRALHLQLAHQ